MDNMEFPKLADNAALLVIDIQDKVMDLIKVKDELLKKILDAIRVAKIFNLSVVVTEQYPKGLGPTNEKVKELLPDMQPIEKLAFSGFRDPGLLETLQELGVTTLLVVGIETHICVMQTCLDALAAGFDVHIISDACGARSKANHKLGLKRITEEGAAISSLEMMLFEVADRAGTPEFKEAQKLIK